MDTSPIRQLIQQSLQNDQRLDRSEFETVRKAIEADAKVTPDEIQPLTDALTHNQIDSQAIAPVIAYIAQHLSAGTPAAQPAAPVPSAPPAAPTNGTAPVAAPAKPEAVPAAPATPAANASPAAPAKAASPWTKTYTVQGNFNHTSVSSGWTGQYGEEKSATKIEGSFQADVNYQQGKTSWKNKLLVEYGNTFVKGETERAISRNNLEYTSEAGRTLEQKDKYKIEIPYATFYTKGPLTELEGRKFRETTGAKITYYPTAGAEYSIKLGAGLQQTREPAAVAWKNEFGVEAVIEAKQSLGFMKAPIVKATGAKADTVGFLDRFEAQVQVNAFNPLQNGLAVSNTDIGVKLGARYYLNDKKSVWLGASQQYEYGGQDTSTWERKFSADAGFKFD